MNAVRSIAIAAIFLNIAAIPVFAADDSTQPTPGVASANPDNTEVNKRDTNKSEPTADQAKNNKSDREIMQKVRKAIVSDKSLSTYAHNIKIISENGKVTLKGPVRDDAERQKIVDEAVKIAGQENVNDELSTKGSPHRS